VKFDHDFIGRAALEDGCRPHRTKVTLALDNEDVMRVQSSALSKGERAKFMEYPSSVYAMHPFDQVLKDGKTAGISTWIGYSANEGKFLTLAMMEPGFETPAPKSRCCGANPMAAPPSRPSNPTSRPRSRRSSPPCPIRKSPVTAMPKAGVPGSNSAQARSVSAGSSRRGRRSFAEFSL
jgi:hypothetical protein